MKTLLPFLILVLIHHFFLAPLIRKKLSLYLVLTVVLLVLFGAWCLSYGGRPGVPPPPEWQSERQSPLPENDISGPGPEGGQRPLPPEHDKARPDPEHGRRPLRPEVMKLIMGVLLLGVDLGAFFYVESSRKERRMKELQAENLSHRLETLRYQINPHFFMNTLNNIHALVDLDPEKAKESIEEFSKMMRILLYEGDAPTIRSWTL